MPRLLTLPEWASKGILFSAICSALRSGRGDPRKAAQEAVQAVVLALRRPQAALSRAVSSIEFREQYDALLIIGVSARNDRDAALRSAQIVGQMRHIGWDV